MPKTSVQLFQETVELPLEFEEKLKQKLLLEASKELICREEQLFFQVAQGAAARPMPREEEKDKLQKDFEALLLQVWVAVHDTFNTSSPEDTLQVLQSAVASIQQLEEQDRRWQGHDEDLVPVWRPQRCLQTHNALLRTMVESRLQAAASNPNLSVENLPSALRRKVCRMGRHLKNDLLFVVREVKGRYPPEFDIVSLYAGFYRQAFSTHLTELTGTGPDVEDGCYLLFWVNDCFPNDILNHEELKGSIQTEKVGALLLQRDLQLLEEQYLKHMEEKVSHWFLKALSKEEEMWLSGRQPDVLDHYYFSPLAIDVIQAVEGVLMEASSVLSDERKTQRVRGQLVPFLYRYKNSLEEFLKGRQDNSQAVMKASLVCMEQIRDFFMKTEDSLEEDLRGSCLVAVSALRDYGYHYFTCAIQKELKVVHGFSEHCNLWPSCGGWRPLPGSRHLPAARLALRLPSSGLHTASRSRERWVLWFQSVWTPVWLAEGGTVVDRLLEALDRQLAHFTDVKPVCMETLLSELHQVVVLQYVRQMMKRRLRMKSEQQQEAAALMCDDNMKIHNYFTEGMGVVSDVFGEGVQRERAAVEKALSPQLRLSGRDTISCPYFTGKKAWFKSSMSLDTPAFEEFGENSTDAIAGDLLNQARDLTIDAYTTTADHFEDSDLGKQSIQGSTQMWLHPLLTHIAELIRLQDPESLKLELATLVRDHPDLREGHVSALLSIKTNLSAVDLRNIKGSVEEHRPPVPSANHSPMFFSKVRVKWTSKMGMKARSLMDTARFHSK
ncbi:tumor necrosis factor alpha-induced protein 2a [Lampris incognitus]|uniref:tumor necrosis factor alpha-induced protein 2a n=1 Tax=Lampris incognitus TaxID=2546036 RepID=UPI0024B5458F|nr:tumor necrosis factor alpha-induced protein 2a [Lampris incognitus]